MNILCISFIFLRYCFNLLKVGMFNLSMAWNDIPKCIERTKSFDIYIIYINLHNNDDVNELHLAMNFLKYFCFSRLISNQ